MIPARLGRPVACYGWYIGGDFTSVGGVARTGIARIRADMTVAPWSSVIHNAPGAFSVRTLARSGSSQLVVQLV